jgi:hypothetical protein
MVTAVPRRCTFTKEDALIIRTADIPPFEELVMNEGSSLSWLARSVFCIACELPAGTPIDIAHLLDVLSGPAGWHVAVQELVDHGYLVDMGRG